MPKTREQRRALDAWEQVQTVKANPKLANDDYKSWARSFPTMVLMDGLPQALAFLAERAGKDDAAKAYLRHLQRWVTEEENRSMLTKDYALKDSAALRDCTAKTLAYAQWLKRFASAELQ